MPRTAQIKGDGRALGEGSFVLSLSHDALLQSPTLNDPNVLPGNGYVPWAAAMQILLFPILGTQLWAVPVQTN